MKLVLLEAIQQLYTVKGIKLSMVVKKRITEAAIEEGNRLNEKEGQDVRRTI